MEVNTKNIPVVLLSDFGSTDTYAGVMKGVIRSITSSEIIDLSHGVKPFSLVNAQYYLITSYHFFPEGTIFCIVVDPGIGTDRKILIAEYKGYRIVVPDNGIISVCNPDVLQVYAVKKAYQAESISSAHAGGSIPRLAAYLAEGTAPDVLGEHYADYNTHDGLYCSQDSSSIESVIIHIDHFGNIVTGIRNKMIVFRQDSYILDVSDKNFTCKVINSYSNLQKDELGIMYGSSGFIEIAGNALSAQHCTHAKIEAKMRLLWGKKGSI
jgi:S-adenosyl-L-methionine hydrolase (adenosine-forming)